MLVSFLTADKRVEGWLMMSGPLPTAMVCLSYVILVKLLGPWFMKNRQPYNLRWLIVVYNLFQTLFSIWLFRYVRFFPCLIRFLVEYHCGTSFHDRFFGLFRRCYILAGRNTTASGANPSTIQTIRWLLGWSTHLGGTTCPSSASSWTP